MANSQEDELNALPAIAHPKPMLLDIMAEKYSLKAEEFAKTVRATCGLSTATPEQFAAFLIVAKTYDLNPLTKEIYAFPGKGGGIVPIVSIDGWVNLVNSNKNCDGFEFEMEHDDAGELVACTCKMYRKDRTYPVTVTEYLIECSRPTDPWKMKHRMLRHKAMIQAARYAFGFAGIYDEDEGRTIAEAVDITPKVPVRVPSPSEVEQEVILPAKDDPITTGSQPKKSTGPDIDRDYEGWLAWARSEIAAAEDGGWLEGFVTDVIQANDRSLFPPDYGDLMDMAGRKQTALNADQ